MRVVIKFSFSLTVIAVLLFNCSTRKAESTKCYVHTEIEELRIYSQILNELVEMRFFDFYLSGVIDENPDGEFSEKERDDLRRRLMDNADKKCTLLLDSTMRPQFNPWDYYLKDRDERMIEIRDVILTFSQDGSGIVNRLNTAQIEYDAKDFEVCLFNVMSGSPQSTAKSCVIGKISMSKIVLNAARDKALMYYDFNCGELCGKGELLLLERNKEYFWSIRRRYPMSVS